MISNAVDIRSAAPTEDVPEGVGKGFTNSAGRNGKADPAYCASETKDEPAKTAASEAQRGAKPAAQAAAGQAAKQPEDAAPAADAGPAPEAEAETEAQASSLVENPEPPVRLPRSIEGGFLGVGEDLEYRAREWRNMLRTIELQRPQLEIAELERDRLYEAFARLAPEVQETGRELKEMIDAMKSGDISGELSPKFSNSLAALDELEGLAAALTSNLLAIRTAWEQYARSIIQADRMRRQASGTTGR